MTVRSDAPAEMHTYDPVSYTHLDVYKRQEHQDAGVEGMGVLGNLLVRLPGPRQDLIIAVGT